MKSVGSSAPSVGLIAFLVAATSVAPASALRAQSQLNPVSKVVELLQGLSAKITTESEAEEKAFKEYVEWCDDVSREKRFEIKTASDKKEQLVAKIAKAAGDGQASAAKIEDLSNAISTAQGDLTSATQIREKEAIDFAKSEKELVDVIDTLGRAVDIVGREMAKNPALAQLSSHGVSGLDGMVAALSTVVDAAAFSSADKQKLLSLVQNRQSDASEAGDEELGAPAASVYKTHSTSILDTLEDLKETAEEELSSLRKAETGGKHNYQMLKQSLEDQMGYDTKSKQEETAAAAASAQVKSTAEADLAETEKSLADTQASMEMANTGCMSIAADHEKSVAARTAEIKLIAEATKVLQSSTVGAVGQTYSLLQVSEARSSLRTRVDLANAEVVTLVKKLAAKHHSGALTQLASRIAMVLRYSASAHEDPFAKVKGLIADMIAKLEAEANSEATEKAYCDEEMAKTNEKKGELEFDIGKLTAKIEQDAAQSAARKSEVEELKTELGALAKLQAEMDSQRQESNADYLKAKKELEEGLEGVRAAITMLREYYGAEAEPEAAMLQSGSSLRALMQQPAAPVFHAKAMGEGTSILGLLDVVESDFAKDLAAEEMAESDAATEYEKMTQANKVTKTLKDQDVAYKTQEAKSLDKNVAELSSDRETLSTEQSAVLEYYAKLTQRCVAKPETYEERKRRREAEVKGLKEALSVLENEAAFVQHGKRGFLRARS